MNTRHKLPGMPGPIMSVMLIIAFSAYMVMAMMSSSNQRKNQASLDHRIYAAKLVLNIAENGNGDLSQLRVMSVGPQLNGTGFEITFMDDNRKVQRRLVNLNTGDIFTPDENGKYHLPDYSERHGEYE